MVSHFFFQVLAIEFFHLLADFDFHLRAGSPAIDKGITLAEVITDIESTPRPQGAGFDIGAYEYSSAPPPPFCGDGTCNGYETCSTCPEDCGPCSQHLLGDLNGDGEVNVTDVQLCVNVILGTETNPDIVKRADVNEDGNVNVLDVQETTNIILGD